MTQKLFINNFTFGCIQIILSELTILMFYFCFQKLNFFDLMNSVIFTSGDVSKCLKWYRHRRLQQNTVEKIQDFLVGIGLRREVTTRSTGVSELVYKGAR